LNYCCFHTVLEKVKQNPLRSCNFGILNSTKSKILRKGCKPFNWTNISKETLLKVDVDNLQGVPWLLFEVPWLLLLTRVIRSLHIDIELCQISKDRVCDYILFSSPHTQNLSIHAELPGCTAHTSAQPPYNSILTSITTVDPLFALYMSPLIDSPPLAMLLIFCLLATAKGSKNAFVHILNTRAGCMQKFHRLRIENFPTEQIIEMTAVVVPYSPTLTRCESHPH